MGSNGTARPCSLPAAWIAVWLLAHACLGAAQSLGGGATTIQGRVYVLSKDKWREVSR